MSIRTILTQEDPTLYKVCHPVTRFDGRLADLLDDLRETLTEANGVGLAAPQVGVLKRVVVIDVGEGPIVLLNPRMLESSGEQTGEEGCLSVPGKYGIVTRPMHVKIEAWDEDMERIVLEGEELLARAICHEMEHLDGHTYVEKAEDGLHDVEEEA